MAKKSYFNEDWLKDSNFSSWLSNVKNDKHSAYCKLCLVNFSLSNMGRRAVTSHSEGTKHKKRVGSCKRNSVLSLSYDKESKVAKNDESTASTTEGPTSFSQLSVPSRPTREEVCLVEEAIRPKMKQQHNLIGLTGFMLKDSVTVAEIIWAIKSVISHHSYRSSNDVNEIFRMMFPDSDVASKFSMRKDKINYTIVYCLAPYFKEQLIRTLKKCGTFVVSFDESLNRVVQRGQMDVLIRYWDEEVVPQEVCTRYFDSAFLGHATAQDLLENFKLVMNPLNLKELLQISMDGPNVNHSFLRLLVTEIKSADNDFEILDIGSCGLHIVHGAFRTGCVKTNWNIKQLLCALHRLFNRRADFIRISGTKQFPKKFCSVRWIENAEVAGTALKVLDSVEKYVTEMQKSKNPPTCQSFAVVKEALQKKMTRAEIGFFQSVAAQIEPFLTMFQTGAPMIPYLHGALQDLLRSLMMRFIKKQLLPQDITAKKLCEIDVTKSENHCPYLQVDIGFSAKAAIAKAKASDKEKMEFFINCRKFLLTMVAKLLERNPLRYKLVKGASCLSPELLCTIPELCESRLKLALEVLLFSNRISSISADSIQREFVSFIATPSVQKELAMFKKGDDRLDHFYYGLLQNNPAFTNFFKFVKLILLLSHGNAQVESGFSINKEVLVENFSEESVVAQRLVYDSVKAHGGLTKLTFDKQMILNVRNARSHQLEAQKEKREAEKRELERVNMKARVKKELKEMEEKKQNLQQQMNLVMETISDLKNVK